MLFRKIVGYKLRREVLMFERSRAKETYQFGTLIKGDTTKVELYAKRIYTIGESAGAHLRNGSLIQGLG